MRVRTDFDFTRHAPAGSEFVRILDTYQMDICDCCGKKRKCDLYEHAYTSDLGYGDVVFMDLCRTCAREQTVEVVE